MRHEHRRDPQAALKCGDLDPHLLAQLEIKVRQRLVEQQHRRIDDQRAGERDALPLAAGHLQRPALAQTGELHQVERLRDALRRFRRRHLSHSQAECDVFSGGHVRKQRVVLEHDADVPPERRQAFDMLALEPDLASRRREESGDQAQRRRLAATGRSEQRDELAFVDVKIDAGDSDDRRVMLLDADEAQRRLRHGRALRR